MSSLFGGVRKRMMGGFSGCHFSRGRRAYAAIPGRRVVGTGLGRVAALEPRHSPSIRLPRSR